MAPPRLPSWYKIRTRRVAFFAGENAKRIEKTETLHLRPAAQLTRTDPHEPDLAFCESVFGALTDPKQLQRQNLTRLIREIAALAWHSAIRRCPIHRAQAVPAAVDFCLPVIGQ
jgi:hypothetical protein